MSITIDNQQPTGNELFRFVSVRGSRKEKIASKRISNISWNQSYITNNNVNTYISDVISNGKNANKEQALQDILANVSTFKSSANYIKSTSDLETEFENVFLANEEIAELTDKDLTFNKINSIFDTHLSNEKTAITTSELLPQEIKLWENIIAQLISPDDAYVRAASISLLKTYHLLRLCSQTNADKKLSNKNTVQDAINARVVLPASIFPLPQIENNTPLPKTEQQKFSERQKLIAEGREKLAEEWHKYHDALTLFDKKIDCYQSNTHQDKNISEYNNAIVTYQKVMLEYMKALAIYDKALEADPNYSGTKPIEPILDPKFANPPHFNWDELPLNTKSDLELLQVIKKVTCLSNPIPYTPIEGSIDETPDPDGNNENTPNNYKVYSIPIAKTRKGLLNQLKDVSGKIASTIKPYDLMIPIGNSLVKLKTNYIPADFAEEATSSGIIEKGYTILGVGDLLKVEQEILCYEAGEVAHIENVMKGEYKDRSTRDLTRREETTITEEETITEEKRDLETTERSEMNKESSTIVNSDFSIDQGVLISGQFGPVKVDTNTNVSVGGSSSTQNSSAVNFSKSVTERASNRIQKRIRKETRITIIKEFEEINKHGFENRPIEHGPDVNHIVGIYRWVNKVYRNTLWNYGKRMMLEFMVPEPSAYHIYAKANSSTGGIKTPLHPKDYEVTAHITTTTTDKKGNVNTAIQDINYKLIDPTVLTEYNYMLFAAGYDADVLPPPEAMSIGKSFSEQPMGQVGGGWDEKMGSIKCEVPIPDGYYCYGCKGVFSAVTSYESPYNTQHSAIVKVYTQPNTILFYNGVYTLSQDISFSSQTLFNVEKILPVSLSTFNIGAFAMNIIAHCKPTAASFEKWQLETYNTIMQAYYQKVSEYEQKLSRLQIINGVQIQGSNPLLYQNIIKLELKKACIQLMADENFSATTANFLQTEGYDKAYEYASDPTMNIANSVKRAPVIRFFEQVFEWDQMTYLFYPYFWANRNRWTDLYNLDDNDPLFANFLKAGAARVVVPVRPGFEAAFAYFNQYYKIPESIDEKYSPENQTYLSIAAELKPNYEREFVESWDNVLPTNLVILQNDASGLEANGLPCWREEGDPLTGIGSMEVS